MKQSKIQPQQTQDLQDAFSAFNALSEQLTDSYQQLESRVAGLTEALAAEQDEKLKELKEKERVANRLQSLLNTLPGGVIVVDGMGYVQEYNPAAESLLGQPLMGIAWAEIIQRAFAPRLDDGHDISLVDGRKVNISTCPLGTEPGQIVLLTDVTEVRHLQDRLGQQQRLAAMGKMAASLAHQIRTPLSAALLYVSNLRRQSLSDDERLGLVDKMTSRLRHLEQLIEDMLLYSKNGKVGEDMLMVNDIAEELTQSLEVHLSKSQTKWSVHNEAGLTTFQANKQMLLSALTNLAMNAIQAMGQGGDLKLITTLRDDYLVIALKDNGPGIPQPLQEQIFDPFYTTRTQGTGLGLAVVSAVANSHGGKVELQSEPGQGSTFMVLLPVCKSEQAPKSEQHIKQIA